MADLQAVHTRAFASQLVQCNDIDWVSITDNAGGNPQLSPMALGKPILYAGKEVLIHLSCKDFNRNGLESAAWELASEGFHNILALSGDYPAAGYHGRGKPVFDIDSIGLLTMLDEMNRGLSRPKMGFPVPIGSWFRGAYTGVVDEFILSDRASSRGIFNADFVKGLVKRHQVGGENHSERLWALVNFEMWMRQFFDGEKFSDSRCLERELVHAT
jgi:hypothetical protein